MNFFFFKQNGALFKPWKKAQDKFPGHESIFVAAKFGVHPPPN
jgi:hypothetical protein